MKLTRRQRLVLRAAVRGIGGRTSSLSHYGRLSAAALARKGLGRYSQSNYGATFAINDAGKQALADDAEAQS